MTKKNPDRRERARLKKIEDAKQSLRYRAVMMVKDGRSYRETAEVLGVSPQFVCDLLGGLQIRQMVRGEGHRAHDGSDKGA